MTPAAEPRARGRGTWLGQDMKHAYHELHERGHAQSLEVWRQGELAGGIYGVSIGRVFFGESMFSRMDNASKIALYFLCRQITAWGYALLDCQIASAHLASLGAVQMPRDEFLRRLRAALESGGRPGRWRFDIEVPAAPAHLPIHLSGR